MIGSQEFFADALDRAFNAGWPVHALTAAEQEAQEATGEFDLTDYRAAEGVYDDDEADCD